MAYNYNPHSYNNGGGGGRGRGRGGFSSNPTTSGDRPCFTCGQTGHLARNCPKMPHTGQPPVKFCNSWRNHNSCKRGSFCHFSHANEAGDEPAYVPPQQVDQVCNALNSPDGVCRRKGCFLSHVQTEHIPWNDESLTVELPDKSKQELVMNQHKLLQRVGTQFAPDPKAPCRIETSLPSLPHHTESPTVIAIDHHKTRNHDDAFSCFFDDNNNIVLNVFIANVEAAAPPTSTEWKSAQEACAVLHALPHAKGKRYLFPPKFMDSCRLQEEAHSSTVVMRLCVPVGDLTFEQLSLDEHVKFSCETVVITDKLEYTQADDMLKKLASRAYVALPDRHNNKQHSVNEDAKDTLDAVYVLLQQLFPEIDIGQWGTSLRPSLMLNTDLSVSLEYSDPQAPAEFIIKKLKHMFDDLATKFCAQRFSNNTTLIVHHADLNNDDFDRIGELLGLSVGISKSHLDFDKCLREMTAGYVSFNDIIRSLRSDQFKWRAFSADRDALARFAVNPVRAHFTKPLREFVSLYNQTTLVAAINNNSLPAPQLTAVEIQHVHKTLREVWHPLHAAHHMVNALSMAHGRFMEPSFVDKKPCLMFTAVKVAQGYVALMPMDFGLIENVEEGSAAPCKTGDVVTLTACPTRGGRWSVARAKDSDPRPPVWQKFKF